LKDEILPKMDDGRERSTVSYEYDFEPSGKETLSESSFLFAPWKDFKPTYRGKEKKDAPKLNRKGVKRFSFMMRRCVHVVWLNIIHLWLTLAQLLWRPRRGLLVDDKVN
jgi:hypothetical protein